MENEKSKKKIKKTSSDDEKELDDELSEVTMRHHVEIGSSNESQKEGQTSDKPSTSVLQEHQKTVCDELDTKETESDGWFSSSPKPKYVS